ncbi:MAG: hypothetical protein L6V85_07585 [Clostridiales bacterium]|nr:MAG: hypothetical protein L6V85_07585 [Clostridiales bacterium]
MSDKELKEHIATNHIDIATIDNNGVVTVYGYGSFIVKVTTEEGNKFATCSVKVVGDKVTKNRTYAVRQQQQTFRKTT